MKNYIGDIHTYAFSEKDKLLIDTNVWLHIYADKTNPSPTTKVYSQAFDAILQANSPIFIDVIIFSEFISNYARLRNLKGGKNFKKFRDSKAYPLAEIAQIAANILQHCQRIQNSFETIKLENLLNSFIQAKVDFNDQLIIEICKANQLTLITDDSDFKNADCSILTANQNLLMRQKYD